MENISTDLFKAIAMATRRADKSCAASLLLLNILLR